MIKLWKSLSNTTRFSLIAFSITLVLGLISMGGLGAALYYGVYFVFIDYPAFSSWCGDWVWPAMIFNGMAWSLGFVFGGIIWTYFSRFIFSKTVLIAIYILTLWLWAALLWYITIRANVKQ